MATCQFRLPVTARVVRRLEAGEGRRHPGRRPAFLQRTSFAPASHAGVDRPPPSIGTNGHASIEGHPQHRAGHFGIHSPVSVDSFSGQHWSPRQTRGIPRDSRCQVCHLPRLRSLQERSKVDRRRRDRGDQPAVGSTVCQGPTIVD